MFDKLEICLTKLILIKNISFFTVSTDIDHRAFYRKFCATSFMLPEKSCHTYKDVSGDKISHLFYFEFLSVNSLFFIWALDKSQLSILMINHYIFIITIDLL